MTTTPVVLLDGLVATPTGVEYTSENCQTTIDTMGVVNVSGSSAVATVTLSAPGGTDTFAISKTVLPGKSWPFPEIVGHLLESGGKVNVACPTAAAMKVRANGRKFT